MERETRQRLKRAGLTAVLALALSAAGMVAGWRLAGGHQVATTLGSVSFEVEPGTGGVDAYVPIADWGLHADAFEAPFRLALELRSLDRQALLEASDGDRRVLAEAEEEVRAGARAAVARAWSWGAGCALVMMAAGSLIWGRGRPRWPLLAAGTAILATGTGIALWSASSSFDEAAFEQPTYFANGRELSRILEVVESERLDSDYGSTLSSILRSVSAVLADSAPDGPHPGRTLVAASDLHANALVIRPLSRMIGDSPLLLAGDFGQRGNQAEAALLAPRVAALGTRVLAVSGNHDTASLMDDLRGRGVVVLRSEQGSAPLVPVDGLAVAGFSDPLEYSGTAPTEADRPVTFGDLEDPEAAEAQALAELIDAYDDLPREPDVVMVHQNRLAQGLAATLAARRTDASGARTGRPLTIVTGDDHAQHVDRHGDIFVVDGGSVGAGGVFDAGREPIGFARLHFEAESPRLASVDLIEVEPFSGAARASRVVTELLCPDAERCSFEPSALDPSATSEP